MTDFPPFHQPETEPAPGGPRRVVALLALGSTALVFAGSFLPLVTMSLFSGSWARLTMSVRAWGMTVAGSGAYPIGAVPLTGIPLLLAAIVLLVAAAAAIDHRLRFLAPGAAVAAAALLTGVVLTVATQVANWVDTVRPTGPATAGMRATASAGLGFWLLLVSVVLAVAAAVLAVRSPRAEREEARAVRVPSLGVRMQAPTGEHGTP